MTVERLVSRVLFGGGLLAIALMLVGVAGQAASPGARAVTFTSVGQVVAGLRQQPVDPLAVAAAGVLVLLVTPIVAVATAIPAFLVAGDRRYAVVAAILAGALVAGLLVGGG